MSGNKQRRFTDEFKREAARLTMTAPEGWTCTSGCCLGEPRCDFLRLAVAVASMNIRQQLPSANHQTQIQSRARSLVLWGITRFDALGGI
jgi:hypothetical protein